MEDIDDGQDETSALILSSISYLNLRIKYLLGG